MNFSSIGSILVSIITILASIERVNIPLFCFPSKSFALKNAMISFSEKAQK